MNWSDRNFTATARGCSLHSALRSAQLGGNPGDAWPPPRITTLDLKAVGIDSVEFNADGCLLSVNQHFLLSKYTDRIYANYKCTPVVPRALASSTASPTRIADAA